MNWNHHACEDCAKELDTPAFKCPACATIAALRAERDALQAKLVTLGNQHWSERVERYREVQAAATCAPFDHMVCSHDGEFTKHTDFLALKAERDAAVARAEKADACRKAIEECDWSEQRLREAEVASLRAALTEIAGADEILFGDGMKQEYRRMFAIARAALSAAPAATGTMPSTGRCEHRANGGTCLMPNAHCGYPECDEYPAASFPSPAPHAEAVTITDALVDAFWTAAKPSFLAATHNGAKQYVMCRAQVVDGLRAALGAAGRS